MKKYRVFLVFLFLLVVGSTLLANSSLAQSTVRHRVGNPPNEDSGWPVKDKSTVTQGRKGATDHAGLFAQGLDSIDVANAQGTPIYTPFDGEVEITCNDAKTGCRQTLCDDRFGNGCGYGKHVVLKGAVDGKNMQIFFGHLVSFTLKQGDKVNKGDQIGLMGTTGFSTGSHLHYEFRGIPMEPPYIPIAITPDNCDPEKGGGKCNPEFIPTGDEVLSSPQSTDVYWFVLHRSSNSEELLKGTPGDRSKSQVVKTFKVRVGKPGERPTPLPQKVGKDYWTITQKQSASSSETAPYFLTLDVPYGNTPDGPDPYLECGPSGNEQCNWRTAGAFGLHGVGGNNAKIDNDGAQDIDWSSGCVRHFDSDITYLYNLLDLSKGRVRYYIEDN